MKKTLLYLFVVFAFSLNAQFTKQEFKEIKKKAGGFFSGVIIQHDRHAERIWISSKPVKFEKGFIQIYYGLKKTEGKIEKLPMRIKVHYQNSSWIFFEEVSFTFSFQKDDDKFSKVSYKVNKPLRNSSTYIREDSDDILNSDVFDFLKYASETKRWINIRLSGNEYVQYVILGNSLKNSIPRLLKVYDLNF